MIEKASRCANLRLVACYDVSTLARDNAAEKYGCRAAESIEDVVNDSGVEGVVIVTPNWTHKDCALAAAKAGKHVFVEKPIANTMEDAFAMIDACREAGVTLAVGHNYRRFGGQRKLKELVENGVPGTIVAVEANFSHSGGMEMTPESWRYHSDKAPALPLMQLGVHCADTLQHVIGPITQVCSYMDHVAVPGENLDVTATLLRFENGTIGYLGSNYATPPIHYVNIYGTKANLYTGFGNHVRVTYADCREEVFEGLAPDDQIEELEEFGNCVRTGAKPEVDGEFAARNLAVVLGALRSSQEGRPVMLSELLRAGSEG